MKKNLFFFVILTMFGFNQILHSQLACGTTNNGSLNELFGTGESDCVLDNSNYYDDPEYDADPNLTLRLILHIARDENGQGGISSDAVTNAENNISAVFSHPTLGINFEICSNDLLSTAQNDYLNWPNQNWTSLSSLFPNHLNIILAPSSSPGFGLASNGGCECGGIAQLGGNAAFAFATDNVADAVIHEIGHMVGLLHTFESSSASNPDQENVTRTENTNNPEDDCSCNCSCTGDMVCDTPADPHVPGTYSTGDFLLNADFCVFDNEIDREDDCMVEYKDDGTLVSDGSIPANTLPRNIMSYYVSSQCGEYFTDGQFYRMRKIIGTNHQNRKSDGTTMTFDTPNTNYPLTWTGEYLFDEDVIVDGELTLDVATVKFTAGHGFVVKDGGKIISKNTNYLEQVEPEDITNCNISLLDGKWKGVVFDPEGGTAPAFESQLGSTFISDAEIAINCDFSPTDPTTDVDLHLDEVYFESNDEAIYCQNATGDLFLKKISIITGGTITVKDHLGAVRLLSVNHSIPSNTILLEDIEAINDASVFVNSGNFTSVKAINTHLRVSNCNIDNVGGVGIEITDSEGKIFMAHDNTVRAETGIRIDELGTVAIYDNTINVKGDFGKRYGIELYQTMSFDIHDNVITHLEAAEPLTYGIYLKQGNSNSNICNRNQINGFGRGIYSDGSAGTNSSDGAMGLYFTCNDMDGSPLVDFFGLQRLNPFQQTSNGEEAGNVFSDIGGTGSDFTIDLPLYEHTYFFDSNEPTDIEGITTEETQNINLSCSPITPTNDPIDNWYEFGPSAVCCGDIDEETEHNNLISQLQALVAGMNLNGGDTSFYNSILSLLSQSNASQVQTEVASVSPRLSNDVMTLILDNSTLFTEQEMVQMLLLNPVVIGEEGVYAYVVDGVSFSSSSQATLLTALDNSKSSTRAIQKKQLADLYKQLHANVHKAILDISATKIPNDARIAMWLDRLEPYYSQTTNRSKDYLNFKSMSAEVTEVKLFPNPSTGEIQIVGNFEVYQMEVYNLAGQKIAEKSDVESGKSVVLDEVKAGIYLIKVFNQDGKTSIIRHIILE